MYEIQLLPCKMIRMAATVLHTCHTWLSPFLIEISKRSKVLGTEYAGSGSD